MGQISGQRSQTRLNNLTRSKGRISSKIISAEVLIFQPIVF